MWAPAAASSSRSPSARVTASGFSLYTDLPAARAPRLTSACTRGTVRLMTISTSGSASISAAVQTFGTSNTAALA